MKTYGTLSKKMEGTGCANGRGLTCAQLPTERDAGLGGLHHEGGHILQMLLALLAGAERAALGLMPRLQVPKRALLSSLGLIGASRAALGLMPRLQAETRALLSSSAGSCLPELLWTSWHICMDI